METIQPDTTAQPPPPLPANHAKIARLRRTARRLRRMYRSVRVASLLCLGSVLVLIVADVITGGYIFPSWPLPLVGMVVGACFVMPLLWETRRKVVQELAESAEKEGIGTFIEGLSVVDYRDSTHASLLHLLPRLQASDAPLLTPNHHRLLNGVLFRKAYLESQEMMELRLAILKAYEQVGSVEDLPVVERLAKGEGCAKRYPHIREAAQSCLPYLQMRSEQQAARETLLRASSAVSDDGASLLRPAHETGGTNSQQLLRASNSEPLE